MSTQSLMQKSFFDVQYILKQVQDDINENKRERPQRWKNFYSVYAYDYTAYHDFCKALYNRNDILRDYSKILKQVQKDINLIVYILILQNVTQENEPQYRNWFFVLDKEDKKQHRGDEKHIYRVATLQKIYEKIYDFCNINPFMKFDSIDYHGLTLWYEDKQAEIKGTELLSIKDRLRLHIKLLKSLRQGKVIQDAIAKILQKS